MSNAWTIGRTGRVYVTEEATYGTPPTHIGTSAFRHTNINIPFSPKNKVASPARYVDPSLRTRFTRRQTASFDVSALFYPSGARGTVPEAAPFLTNGLGAVTATSQSTTVLASPAPTTTTFTVNDATGLAIGLLVRITEAGGANPGIYYRLITGLTGAAVVVSPALPTAPATSDTVVGGVTYALGTTLPKSLDLMHVADNQRREQLGGAIDKVTITLDGAGEPTLQVSGPAQGHAGSPQADPVTFTTVGLDSAIPSGLTGALRVGAVTLAFTKAVFEITNGVDLQNTEFGTTKPAAFYRKSRRAVAVSIDTMVSDQLTLYQAALASSGQAILAQCGATEGSVIVVYCPSTEFEVPDTPDAEETNVWNFKGTALSPTAANSELFLGLF